MKAGLWRGCVLLLASSVPCAAMAQDGLLSGYERRVEATQALQPRWATPLITQTGRIEQGWRTDFLRQRDAGDADVWSYGGGKGVQLIPLPRVEVRFSPPPYVTHSAAGVEDGFGDVSFLVKYRLYGSNEEHHNAAIAAVLGGTVPTGKNGNGLCCAVLSPVVAAGKGLGRFVLSGSEGGVLPVSGTAKLGRQIQSNGALQYHATRFLWLQTEINAVSFAGGKNDGKAQVLATPGLALSRIPLGRKSVSGRAGAALTLGLGEQIALTHFKTYDHAPVFSARLRF